MTHEEFTDCLIERIEKRCTVSDFSQHHVDRRAFPRTKVSVQTELHVGNKNTPMREQTSDLSLSGCYVKTMVTTPVGTNLDVALWLGAQKVMIHAIVVLSIHRLAMVFNFSRCLARTAIEYEVSLSLEVIRTSPTTARKNALTLVD